LTMVLNYFLGVISQIPLVKSMVAWWVTR
jgi:hypothetical protein